MSQTETMEKEFSETELAGGESLVDDEDLTDEEYVEALGEHDEDGNEIVFKKVKSPVSSPIHQQRKDSGKDVKTVKKSEKPADEKHDIAVSSSSPSSIVDTGVNATDKEGEISEKDEAILKAKDFKDSNDDIDQNDDNVIDKTQVNFGGDDDEDDNDNEEEVEVEVEGGEIEKEENEDEDEEHEDEENEDGDDGESIEDENEADDDQENSDLSKQANKELDDDEDRRNPQYIPKRGAFYEHDDRLGTDEEEEEEKEPEKAEVSIEKKPENPVVEIRKAKKLWSDDTKWGHDMFDDDEQRPKPRDEIVSTYGYDIRSEDGPPKARRRRRYGRGPNRYTRSWKDEGAYSKPNETPAREKAKPETNDNPKREKEPNRPFITKDASEKPIDNNRSGAKGQQPLAQAQQQRRTESKSIAMEGSDRKRPQRERDTRDSRDTRDTRDLRGQQQQRDNDRNRDRRRNSSNNNMSPGPSKDLREFINNKNERLGGVGGGDVRRNQKNFFENDFPELPQNSKDKMMMRQQHHNQQLHHQQQSNPTGDTSQPNAWSKSRPKHSDARETIRGVESSLDYKTEPLRVPESFDNKNRSFNLSETNPKIEIVKTQTFENSRYFNRRPLTKGSGSHHPEPSNNIKKDLSIHRNNNRGRTRPTGERDFRSEVGRPITKTSNLTDDYEDGGNSSGNNMEQQQRRNRYNVNKEREYRSNHHGPDDRDRRGDSDQRGGRSYLDDRHYESQFNDNQNDISGGLNKLTLIDKSTNRLSSSEVNDSNNLSKPKRYSSLRQHQAQQQQSEPLSQHQQLKQQPQPSPNQQQSTRDVHQPNSTQYPSTSQHLNLNHPRQSTNVQYYEAATGANPQPPPPPQPPASYYIDNRSPQSSFGFIPSTNIEGASNATRFLSQIAPRFIPPPTAPPPTAPEPRFMAQAVAAAAVAANPTAAGAGTLPPVIPGPPAATYLPTYPPGYPQYPPPPPQTAAQFTIAPPPPPPPPPAPEMYRGGVTYYDTMTQQVSPRQLPQRRPKNALPIVPPPDLRNNPDGTVDNQGYEVDENDLNQNVETITC